MTERANSPTEKLRPWLGTVLTAMLVGLFAFISSQQLGVPHPPAILAVVVVFAAYRGGLAAGLASALIACLYLGYYFSIPGDPFRYAGDNLGLVLSWALAIPAIAVFTGVLRQRSKRPFEADMRDAVSTELVTNVAVTTAELRKSHEQLSLVIENAPVMISLFDEEARCRYANQSYARWLGLDLRQMLGRKLSDILANQATSESDCESVHTRVLAGEKIEHKREHRHPDGRISKVAVSLVPQFSDLGQVTGFCTFINDVTELDQTTLEIGRARERLSLALEGSNLCLWDWNLQDGTVYLDGTWARMLGDAPRESVLSAAELFAMVHPDDQELLYSRWQMVLKGQAEFYAAEHRVKTRSGEWLWIASLGKVVERDARNVALRMTGTNADISERKRAEARIEVLATTDPLTLLPNRSVLLDRILNVMVNLDRKGGAMFALLLVDLDRFKSINDLIGHNLGDQLLQQVAVRVGSVIRKSDTLARLGGDEFAILLSNLHHAAEAGEVTQKITAAFGAPFLVEGHSLNVSCSIGISVFPGDASDVAALLRNADLAMYSAKESGRNTYRYYSGEMNARIVQRHSLERALRIALEGNGQFELYYQPKFSFRTGQLTGVEALLRWHHPEQGMVSPALFIPIAEETRMILPIGKWVLRQACSQVMEWTRRGHRPISLAVNLSVVQINSSLLDTVDAALRESALDAGRLEIEITENVLLRDVDENIDILSQLSARGLRIAMDDFGTGYSSLSYLRRFRLDTIKIDQSFVRNMVDNENDASIIRAIIALAHSLKMTAVAEGVESLQLKDALEEMGCDEWQGFLNSKPMPANEFEKRFLLDAKQI